MDFGLSEEQGILQDTVRGFIEKECPATRLRELFEAGTGHDRRLWRALGEMGITGLAIPERHGGAGLGVLDLALVAEVLGGGAVPVPFLGHALASLALVWGGSPTQQERWLPRLASGEAIGTVAFGEDPDRWQPSEWTLRPDAGRLRGGKDFVPSADLADLLVVGTAGGGLALVEGGAAGVAIQASDSIDRTRGLSRVDFTDAACEPLALGVACAPRVRDAGLVLLAADAFGAAWQLIRMTLGYASTREQFGTPLAQFQAMKHGIADAATEIEPTRGLLWYAGYAVDSLPDRAPHAAAIAKAHIADRAQDVAKSAVEMHGGIGYTWESDVQIWFKRVLFDRAFLGTPETHRLRSASLAGW